MNESEVKKCPKCGGEMEKRYLRGASGAIFLGLFKPEGFSIWRKNEAEEFGAFVCRKCGYIELYKEIKEGVKP